MNSQKVKNPFLSSLAIQIRVVKALIRREYITLSGKSGLGFLMLFGEPLVVMDDDVLDPAVFAGLPWRYRFKLWRLASRRVGWLRGQRAQLWVSTPALAAKYAAWPPRRLAPVDLPDTPGSRSDLRRVFYHGSASHRDDIRFLVPVARELLADDARLRFEIVGGGNVGRLFAALPGASVVRPMEQRSITALPVVDAADRLVGILHIHDILGKGTIRFSESTGGDAGDSPVCLARNGKKGAVNCLP